MGSSGSSIGGGMMGCSSSNIRSSSSILINRNSSKTYSFSEIVVVSVVEVKSVPRVVPLKLWYPQMLADLEIFKRFFLAWTFKNVFTYCFTFLTINETYHFEINNNCLQRSNRLIFILYNWQFSYIQYLNCRKMCSFSAPPAMKSRNCSAGLQKYSKLLQNKI